MKKPKDNINSHKMMINLFKFEVGNLIKITKLLSNGIMCDIFKYPFLVVFITHNNEDDIFLLSTKPNNDYCFFKINKYNIISIDENNKTYDIKETLSDADISDLGKFKISDLEKCQYYNIFMERITNFIKLFNLLNIYHNYSGECLTFK